MMNESALRKNLVELLEGGNAYVTAQKALADIRPEFRNKPSAQGLHTIWEDLEHLRIAQEDILQYALDSNWKSPKWPEGYWPSPGEQATDKMWNNSVEAFLSDLKKVIALVQDPGVDLTAQFPHGEGRTYLRQVLLIADHNAYHLGQIVQTRKALGDWSG
jgi:hypothetical protein